MNYKYICENDLKKYFKIEQKEDYYKLKISNMTKPIFIKLPFILNEDVSSYWV